MCGWYGAFRRQGAPTLYPPINNAADYDVTLMGMACCVGILFLSCAVILPGFRGVQIIWYAFRVSITMFVITAIIVCNFGYGWETASVRSAVPYRPGTAVKINATIGAKIGLRGLNVTLKAHPEYQKIGNKSIEERINYNERFNWDGLGWSLGNEGLSETDGSLRRDYLKAKDDGLPYSILWVVEYFTLDGGSFRWGRLYQQAGFFTHCLLWLSLVTWLLAILAVYMVKQYGAYLALLTGCLMLTSTATYAGVRSAAPRHLSIPFEDGRLELSWGWSFWLCNVAGIIAVASGVFVIIANEYIPDVLDSILDFETSRDKECLETEEENDNEFFQYDLKALGERDESVPTMTRCASLDDDSNPRTSYHTLTSITEEDCPTRPILTSISETGHYSYSSSSDVGSPTSIASQPRRRRAKRVVQRKRTMKMLHSVKRRPFNLDRSVSCPADDNTGGMERRGACRSLSSDAQRENREIEVTNV